VLYALRYPLSFVVLVVAFAIGLYVRGLVQRLIGGQRRPAWARDLTRRRPLGWLRSVVDPYGCVAAAIGGPGWGSSLETGNFVRKPPAKVVAQLLAGPIALAGIGIGALAGFRAWTDVGLSSVPNAPSWLRQAYDGAPFLVEAGTHVHYLTNFGKVALLLAGTEWLAMGILAILPLPPLDGGKLLFALAPRSPGWQRAHYRLDEENWGTLILLVLALPIFGEPLLVSLLSTMVDPLVGLIA
jgi:hypothetical protein